MKYIYLKSILKVFIPHNEAIGKTYHDFIIFYFLFSTNKKSTITL